MCGKTCCIVQRRLDRLARAQVQQVDVQAVGLVGEVGGDPDREALGVRRPRGAVGAQPRQLAFALDDLRVGGHDLGRLAVQADADLRRRAPGTSPSAAAPPRMMNSKCAMS